MVMICRGSRQWGPWRKGLHGFLFPRDSVNDQRVEMAHLSHKEEEGQRDAVPMVFTVAGKV